ncbi:hypothetical protein NHG34_05295 [Aerococcaceae bacterium NML190938]|nr:hypothetical protein [Aerococcaceae bacterium NML190938]
MKILFYHIFVCKDKEYTDYPIQNVFDFIMSCTPQERLRELPLYGHLTMHKMKDPMSETPKSNRTVWMSKYRREKPYEGQEGTDIAELIKGDVLEPVVMHLVSKLNLLIVQFNSMGPRKGSIEAYLNQFINSGEEKWNIKLIPIIDESAMSKIKKANKITGLRLEVLNKGFNRNELFKDSEEHQGFLNNIKEILDKQVKFSESIDGYTSTLEIKKGRYGRKEIGLAMNVIIGLLENTNVDYDSLLSLKVDIKENGKQQTVDAINLGQLKKDIELEKTIYGFEAISSVIIETYNECGSSVPISGKTKIPHKLQDKDRILTSIVALPTEEDGVHENVAES